MRSFYNKDDWEYRPGPTDTSFDIRMARVTLILNITKGSFQEFRKAVGFLIHGNESAYKTSVSLETYQSNLDELSGILRFLKAIPLQDNLLK